MSAATDSVHVPGRAGHAQTALGALALVLAVAFVSHRTLARLNVPGSPAAPQWGLVDFRDAVYYPAVAVLDGVNPYDAPRYVATYRVGNIFPLYAPFTPYIHVPLAWLPFETAELVYCGLVAALAVVFARMCLLFAGLAPQPAYVCFLAAALLVSRPGHLNFVLGQMGLQSAILCLTALHYARHRPNLAGICLALATYKPTFGVPLALLMLLRRDDRAVAVGAVLGASLVVLAAALLMATCGGWSQFWQALPGNMQALESDPLASPLLGWMRIDALAGVARLSGREPTTLATGLATTIVLTVGALAVGRLGARSEGAGADSLSSAIICLTVTTVIYHLLYDLILLSGPIVAVLAGRRREWRSLGAKGRAALAALMLVPFGNLLLTNAGIARLQRGSVAWTAVTCAGSVALVTALVWCCVMAWRRPAAGNA